MGNSLSINLRYNWRCDRTELQVTWGEGRDVVATLVINGTGNSRTFCNALPWGQHTYSYTLSHMLRMWANDVGQLGCPLS